MKPIAVFVTATGVGLTVTRLLLYFASQGAFRQWQELTSAPEELAKFLVADPSSVFLETASGKVYEYRPDAGRWEQSSWPQEIQPPDPNCAGRGLDSLLSGQPPGRVVEETSVPLCGVEYITIRKYALLDDGRVWVWDHTSLGYSALVLCGLGWTGSVLVAAGLAVAANRAWRPRSEPPE
jgi:hypothetical protein